MKIEITTLDQLPEDLLILLKKDFDDDELSLQSIDDVIEYIRDYGDSRESVDYSYINYEYSRDIGKWRLYAYGSCYRKDQSICDEEMSETIEIEDLELTKIEKAQKKQQKLNDHQERWEALFNHHTPTEVLQFIKDQKIPFPKRS
jgi:hypothetical protein